MCDGMETLHSLYLVMYCTAHNKLSYTCESLFVFDYEVNKA